jgi:hypothetical protein
MWNALINNDYKAKYVGNRMQFFYKQEFQDELEVSSDSQARRLLADWARLQIPPAQVQYYQEVIKHYVGASVDDISVDRRGEYVIYGQSVEVV